jgi:HEAT repeat protein
MTAKRTPKSDRTDAPQRGFDTEMAELESLTKSLRAGHPIDEDATKYIRKLLTQRNNFLVAKAAKLASDHSLTDLIPDLLAAYDRFFLDPVKTDPKCWAKEAVARALVKLEHRSKQTYLRGLRHHQMEPSFGPPVDSAAALRGTCAHALVDCPGISDAELLMILLEPLTDADKTVRMDAARAIANVGGISAALLLRYRAMLTPIFRGQEEPEVLGAVYSALLSLEGSAAIPLVAHILEESDDLAAEAAFALADLRSPEALAALIARHRAGISDPWFTGVLLSAIALTRLGQAMDFLVALIERDAREAPQAIEAIGRTAPSPELHLRLEQAVDRADNARLRKALHEHLPAIPE